MAIRQSVGSGNTHSVPYAFGSPVNVGDQLQIPNSAHVITIDQDCTLGVSVCTTHQANPTCVATGSGGSLPAGTYRVRVAATGATGSATASAPTNVTISAGQNIGVVVPPLTPASTAFDVYLTNTGGAAGTERRYATGKLPGTFNCSSALWEDGTVAYASAAALPFGNAIGYPYVTPTTHTGGFVVAAGVTVTCRGDWSHLGDLRLNAGSVIEFDSSNSPSSAAIYREFFGTVDAGGTPTLTGRGTSGARAIIRSAASSAPAQLKPATRFANTANVFLDLEWMRFSRLGGAGAGYEAVDALNTSAFNQLLTDVVFDSDCRAVNFRGVPATGGWILTRVTFNQTAGQSYSGQREACAAFQVTANRTTGTRTLNTVAFTALPPSLSNGFATYTNIYFHDVWNSLSVPGPGGEAGSYLTMSNVFGRKLLSGAGGIGIDTRDVTGDVTDFYLYLDNITGPTITDLNPHGLGPQPSGLGTTRTYTRITAEYNGNDDSGDMMKGSGKGKVVVQGCLIVPNAANLSSGTLFTFFSTTDPDMEADYFHNTFMFGPYPGISTSEGGVQPAGGITAFRSNLGFSKDGTLTNRFLFGKASADGQNDTIDIASPSNVSHNAHWNAQDVTGLWSGGYGPYGTRFSSAPGANDVDLGDSPGADISANGPRFVDPSRKFLTWCETVLGATGTTAQKISQGLNALKAIADSTSANHIPGLTMNDPATWVRAGFVPQAAALQNAAHDALTIGAMEFASPPVGGSGSRARLIGVGGGRIAA